MRLSICSSVLALLVCAGLQAADQAPAPTAPGAGATAASKTGGFKNVGVPEFESLRKDKKNVVLDVRTPKEFAAGHMPGATNIDVNAPDFDQRVAALDPSKTYLVHCAAGVRSAKACDKLSKLKFDHLYNLQGGFRAWEKSGNTPEK